MSKRLLGKGSELRCDLLLVLMVEASFGGVAGGDGVFVPAENWDMKERTVNESEWCC